MKTLFCVFSIIFSITAFCQQQKIDTVFIKGYRIVQFKKNEIEFTIKNEKLRKEGKSYQRLVDFEQRDFFIQIENAKSLDSLIKNRNSFNQTEFFYLPYRIEIEPFLKNNYNISIDLSNQKKLFNTDCNYYFSNEQNEYLYKLYYIEGYSLMASIMNDELSKFNLNISFDEVEKNAESFKVYFIYDIKKIDCNLIYINKFEIWYYKN